MRENVSRQVAIKLLSPLCGPLSHDERCGVPWWENIKASVLAAEIQQLRPNCYFNVLLLVALWI